MPAGCGPPDTGYTLGGASPNGAGIFGPSGGGGGTYVGLESPPAPFAASFFTTTVAAFSFAFYKGFYVRIIISGAFSTSGIGGKFSKNSGGIPSSFAS
jgi:hypothetical protein